MHVSSSATTGALVSSLNGLAALKMIGLEEYSEQVTCATKVCLVFAYLNWHCLQE